MDSDILGEVSLFSIAPMSLETSLDFVFQPMVDFIFLKWSQQYFQYLSLPTKEGIFPLPLEPGQVYDCMTAAANDAVGGSGSDVPWPLD